MSLPNWLKYDLEPKFYCGLCFAGRGAHYKGFNGGFHYRHITRRYKVSANKLYKHLRITHKFNHTTAFFFILQLLARKGMTDQIAYHFVIIDKNMERKGFGVKLPEPRYKVR